MAKLLILGGAASNVRYWHKADISDCAEECPLLGVKRTLKFKSVTSAFDPKRTSREMQTPSNSLGVFVCHRCG